MFSVAQKPDQGGHRLRGEEKGLEGSGMDN